MEVIRTGSAAQTEALGARLGGSLRPGRVLALTGELGAGKTALVRGLARGLGYEGATSSPTYALINEYIGGRLPLFHFDLYRLGGPDELESIGYYDYLARGGVIAVEWSERAAGALPPDALHIRLSRADGDENARVITIREGGERARTGD